ncbi:hypothetical protein [Seonamhaeicola sp. ML3]|uniref:hypothetical protein n=1 Tax=Seonamhaeicola sp. ML3 TaxID=2937786 RepID=UPI00200FA481|nr:hypothetical protein [Seonamhaeicola sp. ML3]
MAKFGFNFNDFHSFNWCELWWFQYETSIGFWALSDLINNQEESYAIKKEKFINEKKARLANIPDEYQASYDQQFFEDGDRTFEQLIDIQRNSICLSLFSYLEGKLLKFLKMMIKEFGINVDIPKSSVFLNINNIIEKEFGVTKERYVKDFSRLGNQLKVRNAIAHTQSYIEDERKFSKVEGVSLERGKVVITDVIYLKSLIKQAEGYFKELLISVDVRLTEINTNKGFIGN